VAVTQAVLDVGSDATDTTAYATASVTAHANKLITIAIMSSRAAAATQTPAVTGFGKTFVSVGNITFNTTATPRSRISIFRTLLASDQTDDVNIVFANSHDGIAWALREWDGVVTTGADGADAVVQFATNRANGSGTLTVTLATIVAGNATYGAFGLDSGTTVTEGGQYAPLTTQTIAGPTHQLFDEWDATASTPVDASSAGSDWGGIGIEIAAAAAGDASITTVVGAAILAGLVAALIQDFRVTPTTA
jgi:hypothetical protein